MNWNGSGKSPGGGYSRKGKAAKTGGGSSRGFVLAAAVVAIALVGVVLYVASPKGGAEKPTQSVRKEKPKKPAKPKGAARPSTKPETAAAQQPEEPPFEVRRYGRSSNVPTSNTNNIHYASQTGLKVTDADGNVRTVRSRPIFKSRADNMLWAAVRPSGPVLSIYPEDAVGIVNVASLKSAAGELFRERVFKETWRGIALALSGFATVAPNGRVVKSILAPVYSVKNLDEMKMSALSPSQCSAVYEAVSGIGLQAAKPVLYSVAVRQGWAPPPTNAVQKAIWQKVHAIPDKPITIEYDPKIDK